MYVYKRLAVGQQNNLKFSPKKYHNPIPGAQTNWSTRTFFATVLKVFPTYIRSSQQYQWCSIKPIEQPTTNMDPSETKEEKKIDSNELLRFYTFGRLYFTQVNIFPYFSFFLSLPSFTGLKKCKAYSTASLLFHLLAHPALNPGNFRQPLSSQRCSNTRVILLSVIPTWIEPSVPEVMVIFPHCNDKFSTCPLPVSDSPCLHVDFPGLLHAVSHRHQTSSTQGVGNHQVPALEQ